MFEQSRGVKRGREQDTDPMLDRHGNAATPKLFVNKLPHNIKEQDISDLFSKSDGFVSVQLGNKVLMAGEFRTCVVSFSTSEQAAAARVALQHYQSPGWANPMLINFVKQDSRDTQQPSPNLPIDDSSLETDAIGNHACATIFVKNFSPEMTVEDITSRFPTSTKIILGNKQLRPGEFRTGYISFEDTAAAVSAKRAMLGFKDDIQQVPLVIYYSVRPQDQTKPSNFNGYPNTIPQIPLAFPPSPLFAPALSPGYPPSHSSPYSSALSPYTSSASQYPSSFSASPYASTVGPLNPYSTLPTLYSNPYPDHYPPASARPFHAPRVDSPSDDARYSISDLFDSKGNAATNGLFVDCLPHDIKENQLHQIFSRSVGFKGLHMGTKALSPHEYRTAVIHYNSTENALRARAKMQQYREASWSRPLVIHYAKR